MNSIRPLSLALVAAPHGVNPRAPPAGRDHAGGMTPDDAPPARDDAVAQFLDEHRDRIIEQLSEWVRIPSVAADPARLIEVQRSAHWLAGALRDAGISARVVKTGDVAAVIGEIPAADAAAPRVLVYSHHDVRHAKADQWTQTDPFTPVVRDGRLYGRGASDAKGQALAHLWGLRAHLAGTGDSRPVVTVKFLIEGEEETGSPHLEELLDAHADELACDVIVFSDTVQWRADAPAPVTSMRGIVNASLTVMGPENDVHSGVSAGVTPNSALALAMVLAGLKDDAERIRIPGFYDGVEPISAERRRELDEVPYDDADWLERTRTRAIVGEEGFSVKERLWERPTIEVISLLAGDPLGNERSVIPAEATASLSIRLVPGQSIPDVAEKLRAFVADELPEGFEHRLEVEEDLAQEGIRSPHGPLLDALERSLERGYGTAAQGRMGNAGGGPAVLLSQKLDAPVLFLGTGLPEDGWHADDESIDLRMLMQGAASIAHLWGELGRAQDAG